MKRILHTSNFLRNAGTFSVAALSAKAPSVSFAQLSNWSHSRKNLYSFIISLKRRLRILRILLNKLHNVFELHNVFVYILILADCKNNHKQYLSKVTKFAIISANCFLPLNNGIFGFLRATSRLSDCLRYSNRFAINHPTVIGRYITFNTILL